MNEVPRCSRCGVENSAEGAKICFMCGTALSVPVPEMPVQVPPVALCCPSCRASISAEALYCPSCGSAVSSRLRMTQEAEIAPSDALDRAARAAEESEQRRQPDVSKAEAKKLALYNKATGKGVCPSCKSPNVRERTTKEGSNLSGANMACCLGCFLTPLAFLALPFMGGKRVKILECQYCSNRWRL